MPKTKNSHHIRVTLQLPAKHWRKLEWLARLEGSTRQDILRRLVRDATRDVVPPDSNSIQLDVEADELAGWQDLADEQEMPVGELIREVMKRVVTNAAQ